MEGTAHISTDADMLRRVVLANAEKYGMSPEEMPDAPWTVFTPHKVLAWTEAEFSTSPTRWKFDDAANEERGIESAEELGQRE